MFLLVWWRAWRQRRGCFHHDHRDGVSWIDDRIIDYRKLYRCRRCGWVWII